MGNVTLYIPKKYQATWDSLEYGQKSQLLQWALRRIEKQNEAELKAKEPVNVPTDFA